MDGRLEVAPEEGRVVVGVHGRLAGVRELERICREATSPLVLDLTYLVIDGTQFTGTSPYVTVLLGREER